MVTLRLPMSMTKLLVQKYEACLLQVTNLMSIYHVKTTNKIVVDQNDMKYCISCVYTCLKSSYSWTEIALDITLLCVIQCHMLVYVTLLSSKKPINMT